MDGRAQRKKVADATNERGFEFGGERVEVPMLESRRLQVNSAVYD